MSLQSAQQTFLAESRDLLQSMEQALLHLENAPQDQDAINVVFGAAHTIKGSAGVVGFDSVVEFAHEVESVLHKVRDGTVAIDSELIALLLTCGDHIGVLLDRAAGEEVDPATGKAGAELTERLQARLGTVHLPLSEPANLTTPETSVYSPDPSLEFDMGNTHPVSNDAWHISVRFGRDVLRNGMDPLSFIRYLGSLGEIVGMVTQFDAMPSVDEMDPESCYLGVELNMRSNATRQTIEDVFQFMREDCVLHILPPHSQIADYARLIEALPEGRERAGELLVESGALTRQELEEAFALQNQSVAYGPSEGMAQAEPVKATLEKQKQAKETRSRGDNLIRVRADKLDQLINLVGELVIAGAAASMLVQRSEDAVLKEAMSSVSQLMDEIRGSALQLRMVQIGETFSRFKRVVRDLSSELNKEIELVISGAETELDKTVIDRIGDPLTHLVRNAIDHGIESSEERVMHGKPAKGTVRLNAYHDSGNIVIEVSDDGAGLNREKILDRALAQGNVNPDQQLSAQEIDQLIFAAGFSTADKVTNLSGRGVGMDVVRRSIEALRGTIDIESHPGAGTTIRIRLPLTLAIIDGFLMAVGKSSFVVPLDTVVECIDLKEPSAAHGRHYVNLRDQVLPYVRLREQFNETGKIGRRESIVVVQYAGRKAGLVVDKLLGEFQTVIRPLGSMFRHLRGISGTTILGSGEVALILDVPSLIQQAANKEAQALKH